MASYREINTELKLLTLFDVRERLQNLASTSLLVSFSVYKRKRIKSFQQLCCKKNYYFWEELKDNFPIPLIKGCTYRLQ